MLVQRDACRFRFVTQDQTEVFTGICQIHMRFLLSPWSAERLKLNRFVFLPVDGQPVFEEVEKDADTFFVLTYFSIQMGAV